MDKNTIKAKKQHLKTLLEFYRHLLDQGHTFWACSAQDEEKKRPFYYVQIHRSRHMITCSTCQTLIGLRSKIVKLQIELSIPAWDLRYNLESNSIEKHMSVSNSSVFNPNYAYL